MSAAKKSAPKGDGLLPKELAESWSKLGMALGGVGALALLAGFFGDKARFGFSYLTGFLFTTTIGIGALFFVAVSSVIPQLMVRL